jgi:tetratricopeptide (TPR) repeat protein
MELNEVDVRNALGDPKTEILRQETMNFMKYVNYFTNEEIIADINEDFILNELPKYLLSISMGKKNVESEAIELGIGISAEVKTKVKKFNRNPNIRKIVLAAYGNQCAITGESIPELLEVALINSQKEEDMIPQNFIPLKNDIHRLFDRYLISIDENYIIHTSTKIIESSYAKYDNKKIKLPTDINYRPSKIALKHHHEEFQTLINSYVSENLNNGFNLCDQGDYLNAIKYFDKAIEIDPSSFHGWNGK